MNEIKLSGIQAGEMKPNQLEFLTYLKYRSPQLFVEYEKLYNNLVSGNQGECEVIHEFKKYGQKHWRYIRNYWAEINGTFESDLIVFTNNSCHNLEIKNYTGLFEYKSGISTVDGIDYNSDCIFQARRAFKSVRKIVSPQVGFQNVKGALIFAGLNNEVKIYSDINDIQIVKRNQLMRFIQKIAEEEKAFRYKQVNWAQAIHALEHFQKSNPYVPEALTTDQANSLNKGIVCRNCSNFDVEITRKFVKCKCGYVELREKAMVRTICEYGVLRYDEHLRRKDVYEFLNGQASTRYLTNILDMYFERVYNGKYTYYKNNKWHTDLSILTSM